MNFAIIAAGEGSRLRQEGVDTPKPLVMLDSRPMIRRLIDISIGCGARSISVIVNEQMTEVARYLESIRPYLPVELRMVVKTTPSSLHSLYEVSRMFDGERCIATTVDTIFREPDFRAYVDAFRADSHADACMAVTSYIDDEKPLYVATEPTDMHITAFLDTPAPGVRYVSGGIYGLGPTAIALLGEAVASGMSRMRNFQRFLVEKGLSLQAVDMGKIIDVDHPGDIEKARDFINHQ